MNNLKQAHVISAIKALSHARLRNYRTFFGAADDRAAYGLYCWNEAVSSALGRILSFAEIAIRNQFHVAISGRYGVGTSGSRDWYNHLALNKKSLDSVKKITHEWRIVAGVKQQIPRTPVPSPDDVISKLTFGFWPHILDVTKDVSGASVNLASLLMDALPGHRNSSIGFWGKQKNRDMLFARVDFCKDLRNRIAHLEPVWKAGSLLEERRARTGYTPLLLRPAPTTPTEALDRLQLSYDRVLELLGWLSPDLQDVYYAGEAHHRFVALNTLAAVESYKRHGGHRRTKPVNLNASRSLRALKKELRFIGKQHGAAEIIHGGNVIALWNPVD